MLRLGVDVGAGQEDGARGGRNSRRGLLEAGEMVERLRVAPGLVGQEAEAGLGAGGLARPGIGREQVLVGGLRGLDLDRRQAPQ